MLKAQARGKPDTDATEDDGEVGNDDEDEVKEVGGGGGLDLGEPGRN